MNVFRLAGGTVDRATDWVARQVKQRVPAADPADRDPQFIASTVDLGWRLVRLYFRAEVRGLERIPEEGPVLLVGNHSGGNVSPEVLVTTLAFVRRFGPHRPFFQLAHDMVMAYPVIGSLLRRFGTVNADPANAEQVLRDGAAVLVYPGGDWEVHRPTWEEDRIDFAGRTGFLRLAWNQGVPIVPVVNIGAQQSQLVLTRGDRIARLLRLDRMLRLKVFPISIALPWGLNVGDLAGHLPLPSKITVEFLDPIDLREAIGPELDLDAAYRYVTGIMQGALTRLDEERALPIVG
ncbi:lysophospholipid acyltransferase family protein [Nocardia implantans]|uniref:Lysophospholipid acyltransferase family protein n=1 Tax=Nocardia implantans TaxID=3108168 RepID=A0ABU6B3J9_9NOCA|nr:MULTISPECIES: lysophospholipid acyltransferase family protein [unclassified Nocardia]MBF6195926.1 acyltransferase family protein [Nocardia beijingensis]MEA3532339.1 lysophospholipid acyltransferase family protein [Nocardia sp. CDC192]MEB3514266.1 lysophospholipid acyltransferase family protein [Nocardia sp. CDC186]